MYIYIIYIYILRGSIYIYISIAIVGVSRLVILSIDRHCQTQQLVNRVHQWPLQVTIDCARCRSMAIAGHNRLCKLSIGSHHEDIYRGCFPNTFCSGQWPSMKNLVTPLLGQRRIVSIAENILFPDNIYRYAALPVYCRQQYLWIHSVDSPLWLTVSIDRKCCWSIEVHNVYREPALPVCCR